MLKLRLTSDSQTDFDTTDLDNASSINPLGIRAGTPEELAQMRKEIARQKTTREIFALMNGQ
jgi:hypothetical protein